MASDSGNHDDRRRFPRYTIDLPATVVIGGKRVACRLANVSSGGALISAPPEVRLGAQVELDIPGTGVVLASVVRVTETHVGLMFPGVVVITPLLQRQV